MDLRTALQTFESTRRLLELCSNRTSFLWRWLFGTPLSRLVRQVKLEYEKDFERILDQCPGVFESLELGYHKVFEDKIVKELDFSSPGRAVAAVAFASYLLDRWNTRTHLSPGYQMDYISLNLWKFWLRRRVYNYSRGLPQLGPVAPLVRQGSQQEEQQQQRQEEQQVQEEGEMRSGLDPPTEN
ncbi:E1B 19K [Simian adenovirus 16]|uniref:E1B protein, small T-antigen n=1 Tax=Simian adenovirus 16 TaxID=1715778 RepID=A0A0M4N3Z1_9ADEN|nr:E1B 19K [Simian adenovirus 16]ALE30384.1 E1B 19K [Simian adenovirus 16]